jgi:hypothetical protein
MVQYQPRDKMKLNKWQIALGVENRTVINPTHGGKRKGSGRPKKEPTKRMSIPISKIEAVKKLIFRNG